MEKPPAWKPRAVEALKNQKPPASLPETADEIRPGQRAGLSPDNHGDIARQIGIITREAQAADIFHREGSQRRAAAEVDTPGVIHVAEAKARAMRIPTATMKLAKAVGYATSIKALAIRQYAFSKALKE